MAYEEKGGWGGEPFLERCAGFAMKMRYDLYIPMYIPLYIYNYIYIYIIFLLEFFVVGETFPPLPPNFVNIVN